MSAVPVAPRLVNVRCEGERGSGPEGADDLCLARIEVLRWDWTLEAGKRPSRLGLKSQGWDWSLQSGIGASNLGLEPPVWDWTDGPT